MICSTPRELLTLIKYQMDINDISQKEIAITLGKNPRSISQYFCNGNPSCQTIMDLLSAMNLSMDINFVPKSDTKE